MGTNEDHVVDGTGLRVALVVSRFNGWATAELAAGARAALSDAGVREGDVYVFDVPGAFELAPTCRQVVELVPKLDAVIALGAVIRGETPHFDYVSDAASEGLQRLAIDTDMPIIFGVLTTDTREQAEQRASRDRGNKGGEAARSALAQAALYGRLRTTFGEVVSGFVGDA